MGVILWIIAIVLFLAIIGLGWETFFTGVLKGADKIGITPIIKNITDSTRGTINDILSDSSQATIENTLNFNS
ncbi:MAG TPA: hypothetical protein VK250_05680 [Nitrososphaeraceae archaeon]|jgi:uncharacterized membrane protein|nr:hypothetical protein [Nitrososphaeraceae archaeon]